MSEVSDTIDGIVAAAASIPGWRISADEEREMALTSYALPHDAVLAEIGVYMGRGTMLLAGPRRLRGSGKVHCVDPFDCSGSPFYKLKAGRKDLFEVFQKNTMDLRDWVEVHKGTAQDVAAGWSQPLDLLMLDCEDDGAAWLPFLKRGGVIILGYSHVVPPGYTNVRQVGASTFAIKEAA